MFRSYFITAVRNFRRNKLFSLINILGLAIGISASMVIFLLVQYDFGFDKFEPDGNRVYRIVSDMKFPDSDFKNPGVPLPLITFSKKELTGVEMFVPASTPNGDITVSIGTAGKPVEYKKQSHVVYADNQLLHLLACKWIAGSKENSLSQPFTTVLTESRAKTYFPDNDVSKVIGKTIVYNDTIKSTVTGVVQDIDELTDFTFKEFISYSTIENTGLKDNLGWGQWGSVNSNNQFFIKLNKGIQATAMTKQIQQLFDKNQKDAYLKNIFSLQPLSDIHFNSDYGAFDERQANRNALYGLLVVAAILLLLGCINFINLTTAQAVQRAKEIGIRKTMGSSKGQLIIQFLSETFLLTMMASLLSVVLVPFIIKTFSGFIPPAIHTGMLANIQVVLFILILIIVVSVLSGFYPAWVLSKYNPVQVLKNQVTTGSSTRKAWLRKSLTVTQFIFAQAFIMGTLVVGQQIKYALTKDNGFKKEGIFVVDTPFDFTIFSNKDAGAKSMRTRDVLLQKLRTLPGIDKICFGGSSPASNNTSAQTMKFNNGKKDIETTVQVKYADEDYFKLYHLQLVAGKYPEKSDTALKSYLVNESYARFIGFKNPADAVGKMINHNNKGVPIIGVMKDFNASSVHIPIKPLVYYSQYLVETNLHIALKPELSAGMWQQTIAQVQKAYKEIYPESDFNYAFFDDTIKKFYESEMNMSTLLSWATGLAIVISCLGLFGLVIYTTNLRTKEIGVRKVLGASIPQILSLISKDFLKLVLFAFIIAVPIAWWVMHKWLENFAYHISLGVGLFILAGLGMMLIALITLSFQTMKAANANPVKSLRTE